MNGFEKLDKLIEAKKLKQELEVINKALETGISEAILFDESSRDVLVKTKEEIEKKLREQQ